MIGPVTRCPVCHELRPLGWTCRTCHPYPSSAAVRPGTPHALAAPVADTTHEPQTAADMASATSGPTPDVHQPATGGGGDRTALPVAHWLAPQPDPVGGGDSVTDAALRVVHHPTVRALLVARREQGGERYGTELRTRNGRDTRADLVQELVDALMYAVQLDEEEGPNWGWSRVHDLEDMIADLVEPAEWL